MMDILGYHSIFYKIWWDLYNLEKSPFKELTYPTKSLSLPDFVATILEQISNQEKCCTVNVLISQQNYYHVRTRIDWIEQYNFERSQYLDSLFLQFIMRHVQNPPEKSENCEKIKHYNIDLIDAVASQRLLFGVDKYKEPLLTSNGRSWRIDALQEMDVYNYLAQDPEFMGKYRDIRSLLCRLMTTILS